MNHSEFLQTTLSFVDTTTKLLKVASKLASTKVATDKAVNEKVAGLADLLKTEGLIDSHEVKRAESQLKDPASALDVMQNIVSHYRTSLKDAQAKVASATIGAGAPEHNAKGSKQVKNANYAGYRRGLDDGPSDADKALLRLIPTRNR